MSREATGGGGSSAQLKQKLGQRLSARQLQLMQMIELPYTELGQRINQELERNPALEEGRSEDEQYTEKEEQAQLTETEMEMGDYASRDEVPDTLLKRYYNSSTPAVEIPFSEHQSLQEYLQEQVLLTELDEYLQKVAFFVIGSLDEDGYLRVPYEALQDDLLIYQGLDMTLEEIEQVVNTIRTLEPHGVGATSLPDCLLLQLQYREKSEQVELAQVILSKYFDLFANKHYGQLREAVNATDDELRSASQLIASLNPTPGLNFSSKLQDTLLTVIPDFEVVNEDGELKVTLYTMGIPEVRVSKEFEQEMSEYNVELRTLPQKERETGRYVKQRLGDARWFVEMLKQRNNTLMETMLAIVDFQREYFLTGELKHLRPMILKDIAERTGYDISTISRVTSTKYVQTEYGTFPLKYFFAEGTTHEDGEEVTTHHIRELLQEMIRAEDKRNPLSDEELSKMLAHKGYSVARRTVAKYRDQLNIPVARLRKEL